MLILVFYSYTKYLPPPNILNYKCLLSLKFAGTMQFWSDLAEWLGLGLLRSFYWLEFWSQDRAESASKFTYECWQA